MDELDREDVAELGVSWVLKDLGALLEQDDPAGRLEA